MIGSFVHRVAWLTPKSPLTGLHASFSHGPLFTSQVNFCLISLFASAVYPVTDHHLHVLSIFSPLGLLPARITRLHVVPDTFLVARSIPHLPCFSLVAPACEQPFVFLLAVFRKVAYF